MKILKEIDFLTFLMIITTSAYGQKHKEDKKAHKEKKSKR